MERAAMILGKPHSKAADTVYEEIRGVCIQMARVAPLRLRVVKGEEDTSADNQPEAHEFLKLDERRIGRDFKLYGFMADATSVQFALADFAPILETVNGAIPAAFAVVRETVVGWDRFFEEQYREEWRSFWK